MAIYIPPGFSDHAPGHPDAVPVLIPPGWDFRSPVGDRANDDRHRQQGTYGIDHL